MRVNTRYINETPSELLPWVLIYLRIEKKENMCNLHEKCVPEIANAIHVPGNGTSMTHKATDKFET